MFDILLIFNSIIIIMTLIFNGDGVKFHNVAVIGYSECIH